MCIVLKALDWEHKKIRVGNSEEHYVSEVERAAGYVWGTKQKIKQDLTKKEANQKINDKW